VNNGINANITKTSIKFGGKILYIGDRGIDIFGNSKQMHYILQAKFRSDETAYVSPKDVREFAAVLMEQPKNTIGFFVSNAKYSTRTQNYANNSKLKLILCSENNIIEKFKETQASLESSDTDDIIIEDITTEEGVDIDIYGIKFNGKIKIGRIYSKNIRKSVKPY
jgi:hypothetical protein